MKTKNKFIMLITLMFSLILLTIASSSVYATTNLKVNNINVNVTSTRAEILWDETKDADGYDVYLDLPSVGYQYIGSVGTNRVYIIGFETGKIYGVKVKAYKGNNNTKEYSEFSPEVKFKIGENEKATSELKTVTNIKAVSQGTTGTLEWNSVKNAQGYQLYASEGNSEYVDLGSVFGTKVNIIGMSKDKVYSIKIKPFLEYNGDKIYGSFSDVAILKYEEPYQEDIELKKVTNVKADVEGNKAKITWDKQNGADGYEISINMPGYGTATYCADETEITFEGFTANYKYTAKVRAYKYVNGAKQYGTYSNTISIKCKEEIRLDKVTDLKVTMDGSKAKLSWSKVNNADGYEILITVPNHADITYTTTGTSKTITGVTNSDDDYTVRIRAYKNVNGKKIYGDYSDKKYFKYEKELDKVTGVKVTVNGNKATVKWNEVKNADGYVIGIETPSGAYDLYTTTKTSKTISGITDIDDDYTVKVKAYKYVNGKKEYGEYSNKKSFKAEEELDKVTGVKVTVNGNKATVKWDRVKNADGYVIGIETPSGAYDLYTTTKTSKTISGITDTDDDYTVKVKAYKYVNGKKEYGEYSNKKSFKAEEKLDKVTGLEVIRHQTIVVFRWNEVKNADGYEIALSIPGLSEYTYTEESTMRYMTGFTETRYKYTVKVRAYKYVNGEKVYGDYSRKISF